MIKNNGDKSNGNQMGKAIEQSIKTNGFLFPETVEEVKEFERIYGTTDVIVPEVLQEPMFLFSKVETAKNSKVIKFPSENFAMAAREGTKSLPKEIQQKIINDINAFRNKAKKKKQ